MEEELKYIIESLLLVSEAPLPMDRLKKVLEEFDTKEIKQALEALAEEYDTRVGGFMLREVAGGYQIRTRPEYAQYIKRLIQPGAQRLSKAALETLAIIAYKQPIIRADIEFIRGVDCGGVLRMLLEKKLVRVLGRKEIPGRPMIYATTKQFLEIFDLKDLKDLPSPKEIEALGETHILDMETENDGFGEEISQETAEDKKNENAAPENESLEASSDNDAITASEPIESESDISEPVEGPPADDGTAESSPLPKNDAETDLITPDLGDLADDDTYSREEIQAIDSGEDIDETALIADEPVENPETDPLNPEVENKGNLPEPINTDTVEITDNEVPEDKDSGDDDQIFSDKDLPEKPE